MNLQEYFLRQALQEARIEFETLSFDHISGLSYIDGIEKGLIFPASLLDLCLSKWSDRTHDYFFSGVLTSKREWCKKYEHTKDSHRGRNPAVKYTYDEEYYSDLGKTKFALCPTGDCPWSYRFFEAIMCGAIPVLGDDDIDFLVKDFKFYRHSDEKVLRPDWVYHNLLLFQKRNIL